MASSHASNEATTTPAVDRAVRAVGPDTTPARRLVATHLLANGTTTVTQAQDATAVPEGTVRNALGAFVEDGLATFEPVPNPPVPTNEHVYEPAGALARAHDADAEGDPKQSIIETLATLHYRLALSNAKAARIAKDIDGLSSKNVARTLEKLEDDGAVERVLDTGTKRWRLVGAGEYVPYRAGGSE